MSPNTISTAQAPYRWPLWILATIMLAAQNLEILTVGAYANDLGDSLHIGSAQVGALFGIYTFFYAVMQLPSGIAFSRFRPTSVLIIACLILAGGNMMFAFSSNLYVAYTGRILSGIGGSFFFLGYVAITASRFDALQFATLLGVNQLVKFLLAMLVLATLPMLIQQGIHWRQFFGLIGVLFLTFVPFLLLLHHRLPQDPTSSKNISVASLREDMALVFNNPQLIRTMIIGFFGAGIVMAFGSLWYLPLAEALGFSRAQADHLDSLLMLFMGLGMAGAGWVSDRLHRRKPIIVIGLLCSLLSMIALILLEKPSLVIETTLVIALAVSSAGFFAILYVLVKESVPTRLATTASGVINTLIFAGLALGQYLPGQILDFLEADHSGKADATVLDYRWALMIYLPCLLVSLLLALKLRDTRGVQPE